MAVHWPCGATCAIELRNNVFLAPAPDALEKEAILWSYLMLCRIALLEVQEALNLGDAKNAIHTII